MASLKEILLSEGKRPLVIDDCVRLVDDEVRSKSGLSGMAVKGAYAIVKKIKPGIIREAVDRLIDDFVEVLDGYYESHQQNGSESLERYLDGRRREVADSLLGVTDKKIAGAKNRTIKKAYEKLRPTGQKHVEAAVPGVGRVVARHV